MRVANRFIPIPTASALMLASALAGCADLRPSGSLSTAGVAPAVAAACRQQADAVFLRRNRALLSERDTTGSPFSSTGVSGITTDGLGDRYARDRILADCLAANRHAAPGLPDQASAR